jgi:GalNAc-alpha-(1->4)-GalNAc-alpha-(1->3)-diNAcBac-PP-undecaprenol alpha-1,4-N-acetyl-D-galactosaminyltransferase
MENKTKKHFCFILPSLVGGGMERVMVELANNFVISKQDKVTMVLLGKNSKFYTLNDAIKVIEPKFDFDKNNRIIFSLKTLLYIRRTIKQLQPDVVLSFGEKWNSFNLLALLFTQFKIFISERSSPKLKLPIFHEYIRKILYKSAFGIIAQTNESKIKMVKLINHKNIITIGNPVRKIVRDNNTKRENIILNIGRFISTKNQMQLIEIFSAINPEGWKLVFVGDGKHLKESENLARKLKIENKIEFIGESKLVDQFYSKCKIFAFTSTLEGFPNALAEALVCPVATISFNCSAGPSDLIINNYNGFLVEVNDLISYKEKLETLIQNENLRVIFEQNSIFKMKDFELDLICNRYYNFLTNENTN